MNAGGVDASTEVLRIAFYVDGMRISESNVGSSVGGSASLAAGEASWLQTASQALPVTFEAICEVDSRNDIAEADEENNLLTKVLSAP
jgi:subtilase family serine protease